MKYLLASDQSLEFLGLLLHQGQVLASASPTTVTTAASHYWPLKDTGALIPSQRPTLHSYASGPACIPGRTSLPALPGMYFIRGCLASCSP